MIVCLHGPRPARTAKLLDFGWQGVPDRAIGIDHPHETRPEASATEDSD